MNILYKIMKESFLLENKLGLSVSYQIFALDRGLDNPASPQGKLTVEYQRKERPTLQTY